MEYELHIIVSSKGRSGDWVWEETSLLWGPVEFESRTWRYEIISAFVAAGQLPPFPYLTEMFYFRSAGKDIVFFDWDTGQPLLALIRIES